MDPGSCPLVSILTPTYNHELYIRECIKGVLSQTYPHWELIIIDDGSCDHTRRIVSQFEDSRIRYYYQEHKGILRIAETYNHALSLANGSLIAPLEGDDFWPVARLGALVPAFADPRIVVSYGVHRAVTADGKPTGLAIPCAELRKSYGVSAFFNKPRGAISYAMLHSLGIVAAATASMIRRSAIEAIGGFQHVPGLPVVDYPTLLELGLQGEFSFINETMCYWRKHGSNSSALYRDAILRGLYLCALEFVYRHQHESHFHTISKTEIKKRWEKSEAKRTFWDGRRLLAEGQWKEARSRFRTAFRSRGFDIQAAALFAMAASYLQFDLEFLIRIVGRESFALSAVGAGRGSTGMEERST